LVSFLFFRYIDYKEEEFKYYIYVRRSL